MKFTKSRLKQIIKEAFSREDAHEIADFISAIVGAAKDDLSDKIDDVDETNILRLQHYDQTGEILKTPFREPEGTGELGALPSDIGEEGPDTRSMRAPEETSEEEIDPEHIPTEGKIKFVNSHFDINFFCENTPPPRKLSFSVNRVFVILEPF